MLAVCLPCANCSEHFQSLLKSADLKFKNQNSAFDLAYLAHSNVTNRLGGISPEYKNVKKMYTSKNCSNDIWMFLSSIAFSLDDIKNNTTFINGVKASYKAIYKELCIYTVSLLSLKNNTCASCIQKHLYTFDSYESVYEWVNDTKFKCSGFKLGNEKLFVENCPSCSSSSKP